MKSWVKWYTETNDDPKVGTLTWAQRGIWAALVAEAGLIDGRDDDDNETGELDTPSNMAWRIRCEAREFTEALALFIERGMVEERDGILFLPNYGERQRPAPQETRVAWRERQRKHRMSQECHGDVTDVTSRESESESESESDPEGMAPAPPAATPKPEEEAEDPAPTKKRNDSRSDPRSKTPAIQAVRDLLLKYPNRELWDIIIATLGDTPDIAKLTKCRQEWVTRGYNPQNMVWLTDWYANGIGPPGGAKARASPEKPDFQALAAKYNKFGTDRENQ
jgi:hypothetical protein